jgi:hypothetical protein
MKINPENNPFIRWRRAHPHGSVDRETNIRIEQWVRVDDDMFDLFDMYDDQIEPWLTGASRQEPDIVAFIARYGYARIVTGDWTDLPIDIPESELEDWKKNSGLATSIDELRHYQAGVAGCIPEMLHGNTARVITLINKQLEASYAELADLANRPVADFTPENFPSEDIGEEHVDVEYKELTRIVDLYEKLNCFELGIEELRMFMITEDVPEFHLPNKGFYDALVSISSHRLLTALKNAEPKLRAVLRMWSQTKRAVDLGKPFYGPDETEPASFWWRHFKAHNGNKRGNGRSGGPNGHRRPRQGR